MFTRLFSLSIIAIIVLSACKKEEPQPIDTDEENAGGATTVFGSFSTLFEQLAPNLNADEIALHNRGDIAFEATFVTAPATINPGLGPLFNNTSCAACHGRNGRASFPSNGNELGGLLLRISLPGEGPHAEPLGVPGYGGQLQQRATFNTPPEAQVSIQFVEAVKTFLDGESIILRKPVFSLQNSYDGNLPANVLISPRIASPVIGLGLLEAISESDIVGFADENDTNGDGISGKPNYVWDELN